MYRPYYIIYLLYVLYVYFVANIRPMSFDLTSNDNVRFNYLCVCVCTISVSAQSVKTARFFILLNGAISFGNENLGVEIHTYWRRKVNA